MLNDDLRYQLIILTLGQAMNARSGGMES